VKVLFVDHRFHGRTHSTDFLIRQLSRGFGRIDLEYIDVDKQRHISALAKPRDHDLVVIFQLDFLAPIFLAAGYHTVVVPMYDGSANMPYEHWIAMKEASFVCFSRTIHERVTAAGSRSLLVKYFVPPCDEDQLPTFECLRGILWMRRPQDGLTPKFVEKLLGAQLTSLHVHNAPDDGTVRLLDDPGLRAAAFPVGESRWNIEATQYLAALKKANVFFAPRVSEGIGMTMLEAFANGLLVIANDDAVHNEYVANWTNGILFNRNAPEAFDLPLKTAKELAYRGWMDAKAGFEEWLETQSRLLDFIRATPPPSIFSETGGADLSAALWNAYAEGLEPYTCFLRKYLRR
jgi:glycosyltransferase involved in cell wall biosynthesis